MNELITVIVPVYNVENYLERCIDSIINQTYKKLEILLINDGSKDKSGEICDDYAKKDDRIKVIHKENGGVSSARNIGLEKARGEYISFIDADDWIEKNMYEEMLKRIEESNVKMVRCSYYKEYDEKQEALEHIYKENQKINLKHERQKVIELLISGRLHAYLPLLLIKKSVISKNLKFNTQVAMREDMIWLIDLVCSLQSFYIDITPYYHYYQNPNSATNSKKFEERNIKNMLVVYDEIYKILERNELLNIKLKELLAFSFFSRISSEVTTWIKENKKRDLLIYLTEGESFRRDD